MKKYDIFNEARETKINVKIKVPEVNREFNFKVIKKTRVKELCMKLSEFLSLDPIRTNVFLYEQHGFSEMNPTSTLLQNFVENGSVIIAKVHYTGSPSKVTTFYKSISKNSSFGEEPAESYASEKQKKYPYDIKTSSEFYGARVEGVCVNPYCIGYNKQVTFPLGCGMFDMNYVLNRTKCQACPYKDKDLNKPIVVKNVILTNCFWKLEGHYYDTNGFLNMKAPKAWNKAEGVDPKTCFSKLYETSYVDSKLIVKGL